MESGICDCPAVEEKLITLAEMLQATKGKKVYGYLKKPVKAQVDSIVDELAQLPAVAECYEVWNKLHAGTTLDVWFHCGGTPPPQAPAGQQVDRKLRLKIREKKIAMGHKADDHEEQFQNRTMTMG